MSYKNEMLLVGAFITLLPGAMLSLAGIQHVLKSINGESNSLMIGIFLLSTSLVTVVATFAGKTPRRIAGVGWILVTLASFVLLLAHAATREYQFFSLGFGLLLISFLWLSSLRVWEVYETARFSTP